MGSFEPRVFAADHHEVPLPEKHRFPMSKYRLLRERLVERGVLTAEQVVRAPQADLEALLRVHDADYVRDFLSGNLDRQRVKRIGFPWSEALVARTLASAGGTLAAAAHALEHGFAGVLAGGTHHAYRDFGSGYCVFNDLAIAARWLLEVKGVSRVLIVDLDVHQGDGTAALFADEPRVFTLSLHGARNFPARKQVSDLDVALPDETGDTAYAIALRDALAVAFERSDPEFVLYQAGVDPLEADRLGRLSLTLEGLADRDAQVFSAVRRRRLPVVVTLGGGYADPIEPTLAAHEGTYRTANEVFGAEPESHPLHCEVG